MLRQVLVVALALSVTSSIAALRKSRGDLWVHVCHFRSAGTARAEVFQLNLVICERSIRYAKESGFLTEKAENYFYPEKA